LIEESAEVNLSCFGKYSDLDELSYPTLMVQLNVKVNPKINVSGKVIDRIL